MKKMLNVMAFLLIVGFAGAWECGGIDFKQLLCYSMFTLIGLYSAHFVRIIYLILMHNRKEFILILKNL